MINSKVKSDHVYQKLKYAESLSDVLQAFVQQKKVKTWADEFKSPSIL